MINIPAIVTCLKNIIGFDQRLDEDYPEIPAELLETESGITLSKIHPLLTIENIFICVPETASFSEYISKKRDAAIEKLIHSLYSSKHLNDNSRELLSDLKMYEGSGNYNDKIVNDERFVGYKFTLKEPDTSIVFRKIGMQIDTVNPTFKLYIFHSAMEEPVKVVDINYDEANSFAWFDIDKIILPFISGGYYSIGYYESDLVGQAINREQLLSRNPSCAVCNPINSNLYKQWSKYISVEPFYVDPDHLPEDGIRWNSEYEVTNDKVYERTNWGLNLSLSIFCDPSDLFCRNRDLFVDALSKQIGVEFLTEIAYSNRDSQGKQKLSQMAFAALNGMDNRGGMKAELESSLKAINFNTSGLNEVCLPCQDKAMRLKYKSVY